MLVKSLKGMEEQKSSGLLSSRLNYHSCNLEVRKLLLPSRPPCLSWRAPLKLVPGLWKMEPSYWGRNYLSCQPKSHGNITLALAFRTPAARESRNAVLNFPSSARRVRTEASAKSFSLGSWLAYIARSSWSFQRQREKIMTLDYKEPIKWLHHLHPCQCERR